MVLGEGNWPENPYQIVVGQDTFDRDNTVGDIIDIKGTDFEISGILDFNNLGFNHLIYMDYDIAQITLSLEDTCSLIYVVYDNSVDPIELKETIQSQHPVLAMDMNDLNIYLGGIYNVIELAEFVIGLLPLLICSIFFFVLISYIVRTRYHEYALLKTIGFSEGQLISFLFVEVMIITIIGYVLGTLIGYFFYTITFQYVTGRAVFPFTFESWDYYWINIFRGKYNFGIMFALLAGLNLLSTTFPALSIRRKSIVEVLRS
jgi:ABC-type antimicrobial peptide transport system permease subunit